MDHICQRALYLSPIPYLGWEAAVSYTEHVRHRLEEGPRVLLKPPHVLMEENFSVQCILYQCPIPQIRPR